MDVREKMLGAEAAIAGALGAITELQLRVADVGAAADAAFAVEALRLLRGLLLTLLCAHGIVEMGGLLALTLFPLEEGAKLRPEKDGKIHQRDDRKNRSGDISRGKIGKNVKREKAGVDDRQNLHANGDDEKQQHPRFGIQHGKGKEHGKVDVIRAVKGNGQIAVSQAHDRGAEHGQEHAADIIDRELRGAPLPFQHAADPVIEIAGDEQRKCAADIRNKDKGNEPPYLTVHQTAEMKGKETVNTHACGRKAGQKINGNVADDDIQHQIGNAKIRMQNAKPVNGAVQLVQSVILQII